MKRISVFILVLVLTMHGGFAQDDSGYSQEVDLSVLCGEWVEIDARPDPGYRFVRWSDGVTEAHRIFQVFDNVVLYAYFEEACGGNAKLPIINKYDWVLMLDVRKIRDEMGYAFIEEGVSWYRVVGKPDEVEPGPDPPDPPDPPDIYVGGGYSFTLDMNLEGSGSYYAIVDILDGPEFMCRGPSRSEIVSFESPPEDSNSDPPPNNNESMIRLIPTVTHPNEIMRIVGLDPRVKTRIRVYTVTGQLLMEDSSEDAEEYLLTAHPGTGVYEVVVYTDDDQVILKYLVKH